MAGARSRTLRLRSLRAGLVLTLALSASAIAPALAHASSAWWHVDTTSAPTIVPTEAGKEVILRVIATNLGNAPASGPVTLTDTLPKGLNAFETLASAGMTSTEVIKESEVKCTPEAFPEGFTEKITCPFAGSIRPYESITLRIRARVEAGFSSFAPNHAKIEAAGTEAKEASGPLPTGGSTPFGIEKFALTPESEGGATDTQAGSHPYQLTTQVDFNQSIEVDTMHANETLASTPQLLKDVQTNLPPGLIGDARASEFPQCSDNEFERIEPTGVTNACKPETALGVAVVYVYEPSTFENGVRVVPVFNLSPAPGEPARFGFNFVKVSVVLDTAVRSDGDYSVAVQVHAASQAAAALTSLITLWGTPGDASHVPSRGWECLEEGRNFEKILPPCTQQHPTPAFLSLPTACGQSLGASALIDSWSEPGPFRLDGTVEELDPRWKRSPPPSGEPLRTECKELPPFSGAELNVEPDTKTTNTPTGALVDVKVPQGSTLNPGELAESAVRKTVVTLPPGMLLNPSAANGLATCSSAQIGFTGKRPFSSLELNGQPTEMNTFSAPLQEHWFAGEGFCPEASKVGTVKIKSPDLDEELEGYVYLAAQGDNPFGSNFAMYIVAQAPRSKVYAKLAGQVLPDPNTGQITTVFENTPQVPFEELKINLFSGSRASITTPPACGAYTTTSSFEPWSGGPAQSPSGTFELNSGTEASGCPNPLPLAPGIVAGSSINQAGAFSPFELTLFHRDQDQAPTALTVNLPGGLAAMLKNVTLCKEAQANAGTCGPESQIGKVTAIAGLGTTPFTAEKGRVYITEKYGGAPFGLSVVIPSKAGPFDFGNVVTRSSLFVDPNTAAVTIVSQLPTMVNTTSQQTGVPVQLKQINVVTDTPNFQFNPTNCSPLKIKSTVSGAQGGQATVESPYQVQGCQNLPFKPTLEAEVASNYTKTNGTGMKIVVTSSKGQANISKTKVVFPEQLPSRLTTIQKACPEAVFNKNPATCPEGSVIGSAIAHTPVLKSVLQGPAYLVSHGNAAFPDAEFVLQGEGITLILDGQTNIHNGVTSSTFNSVPDAPVERFEVLLPAGPHSAFTGHGNLCAPTTTVTRTKVVTVRSHGKVKHVRRRVKVNVSTKLALPTTMGGQNGHVIEKSTPLKITGCKAVKGTKKKKKPKKHSKKRHSTAKKH